MKANRKLLPANLLTAYQAWLDSKGVVRRPGKGFWEVMQVDAELTDPNLCLINTDLPSYRTGNGEWASYHRRYESKEAMTSRGASERAFDKHLTVPAEHQTLVRLFLKDRKEWEDRDRRSNVVSLERHRARLEQMSERDKDQR